MQTACRAFTLRRTSALLALLLLAPASSFCAPLPEIKTPKRFFACKEDADCAIAGDSCRSCGKLIIINRKYLKDFLELDARLRKDAGIFPACEACSTARATLKCVKKRCLQGRTAP